MLLLTPSFMLTSSITSCSFPVLTAVNNLFRNTACVRRYRVEHVEMILHAGKPVLVEKPFACNSTDAERLINLANEKGLFIMEGMWTRYFPAVEKARELIDEGAIGPVVNVVTDFSFNAADSGK